MKKILVVEDESAIRDFIVINLKRAGYETIEAESGEQALKAFKDEKGIAIVLLDVMLGGIDGYSVCSYIREKSGDVGIVMLTAKSVESDKVSGFSSGADDYITKPFSPAELVMRIDALYRRVSAKERSKETAVTSGPFLLDTEKRMITKNGEVLDMTSVEYQIMNYFMTHTGKALSREDILNNVWGDAYVGEYKTVDVNIRRLRMKIEEDPAVPKYIQTIWGYGYRWGN